MADRPYLVVATPCYGGQVTAIYTKSLLKLHHECARQKIDLAVLMGSGDALITRSRAELVANFLEKPEYTHLLFIDADIGFEAEQVMRLVNFDADVTACAYPVKMIDWERVRGAVARGHNDLEHAALRYVYDVADEDRIVGRDGFIKAKYAGTGFLMIRRAALTRLCAAHPELKYRRADYGTDRLEDSPHRFALFECLIDPASGRYLSEDFAFCQRWADLGGEIWIDAQSRLTHFGAMPFHGDFATYLVPAA